MSEFKKVKTWKDILKDPRVEMAYRDRYGYWVDLHPEYINDYTAEVSHIDSRLVHGDDVAWCVEKLNNEVREATPKEIEEWLSGHGKPIANC